MVFNFEFGDAKSSNKSTLGNLSGTPYKDFTDYSKVLGRRAVQAPAVREEQFKNALNQAKMNKTTSASSLISAYLEYADYEYSIGHYASAAKLLTEVESSNTLESSRLDRKHQVKLAHCCDNIGLRKQALSRYTAIFEEALALEGINAESSTNSQLAIARRSLVEHCARFGRVKEAKKLIQDAITSFESIRPVVCLSQRVEAERYFAALYNRLKLHNAEQKHLLKALSLIETKFDSLTPESLEVRSDLAASYISAGNRTSAISLYRDMVDSYEHKDSDDYANSLSHLAVFYCEQKMLSEAEKAIRKALQLRDSIYGANDERLVTARFSLLEILEAQGRLAEAIEEADRIILPEGDNRWHLAYQLSQFYLRAKKFSSAKNVCISTLERLEKQNDDSLKDHIRFLSDSLLSVYKEECDSQKAEILLLKRANECNKFEFELLDLYLSAKQFTKAQQYCDRSIKSFQCASAQAETRYLTDELARAFIGLAKTHFVQANHQVAKYYLLRAFEATVQDGFNADSVIAIGTLAKLCLLDQEVQQSQDLLEHVLKFSIPESNSSTADENVLGGFSESDAYGNCEYSTYPYISKNGLAREDKIASFPRNEITSLPEASVNYFNLSR